MQRSGAAGDGDGVLDADALGQRPLEARDQRALGDPVTGERRGDRGDVVGLDSLMRVG